MQRYGIPYKGSKNFIARWVVEQLPANDNFYDLFAGGCAVTHAAILSGKYRHFLANDILSQYPQCFLDAVNGKYADETRTITREEFHRLKDTDPYVATCWSFGNNCRNYLWAQEKEERKQLVTTMLLAPTLQQRYNAFLKFCNSTLAEGDKDLRNLSRLQSLQNLQSLQQAAGLFNNLKDPKDLKDLKDPKAPKDPTTLNLTISGKDYQDIPIPPGTTVYCDIPYKNTNEYKTKFNHERFYKWALEQPFPVYVSEYDMPEGFTVIAQRSKLCTMCKDDNSKVTIEKIFVQTKFAQS